MAKIFNGSEDLKILDSKQMEIEPSKKV